MRLEHNIMTHHHPETRANVTEWDHSEREKGKTYDKRRNIGFRLKFPSLSANQHSTAQNMRRWEREKSLLWLMWMWMERGDWGWSLLFIQRLTHNQGVWISAFNEPCSESEHWSSALRQKRDSLLIILLFLRSTLYRQSDLLTSRHDEHSANYDQWLRFSFCTFYLTFPTWKNLIQVKKHMRTDTDRANWLQTPSTNIWLYLVEAIRMDLYTHCHSVMCKRDVASSLQIVWT